MTHGESYILLITVTLADRAELLPIYRTPEAIYVNKKDKLHYDLLVNAYQEEYRNRSATIRFRFEINSLTFIELLPHVF